MTHVPRIKLLTFQSWVTRWDWYEYARDHPAHVPFLLTDRSPCQDPFFDPFARPELRRPIISGLCRRLKHFQLGERFIYITRMDYKVRQALGIPTTSDKPHYLAVAALIVRKVVDSHKEAAALFDPRQYVPHPDPTPYPPNLAFERDPVAAASRECCISFDEKKVAYTPMDSTTKLWKQHYRGYYYRQVSNQLRAALCKVERVDGIEALQLMPDRAPVLTPEDWGGAQLNVHGIQLNEALAEKLTERIAAGRGTLAVVESAV